MLNIKDKSINSLITILNKRINSIRLGNEKVYLEFDNIKGLYDVTLKEKVVIVYINKEITADEREYIKNTIKNIYNRESIIKITLNDSIIPDGFIYDNLGILVRKEKFIMLEYPINGFLLNQRFIVNIMIFINLKLKVLIQ